MPKEIVLELDLPQYEDGLYKATKNGDITVSPIGTPEREYERAARTALESAFQPEEGYVYQINDEGHLVRWKEIEVETTSKEVRMNEILQELSSEWSGSQDEEFFDELMRRFDAEGLS